MNSPLSPETYRASVDIMVRDRLAMLAMLNSPDPESVSRAVGLSSFVRFIEQNVPAEEMVRMSEETSRILQTALLEEV